MLEKFSGKIKILSTHNILCRKFQILQSSVGKLQLSVSNPFNPRCCCSSRKNLGILATPIVCAVRFKTNLLHFGVTKHFWPKNV